MSRFIRCDACERMMRNDSTSIYHTIWIDQQHQYHLCENCFTTLMTCTFQMRYDRENLCWVEKKQECCPYWKEITTSDQSGNTIRIEYRCYGVPDVPVCNCEGDKNRCDCGAREDAE